MCSSPEFLIPGILVRTGSFIREGVPVQSTATEFHHQSITIGTQICVDLFARPNTADSIHETSDGISVVLSGYISEITYPLPGDGAGKSAAGQVAALYRRLSTGCLQYLRGAYQLVIADRHDQSLLVITDRRNTRPLFARESADGAVLLSPEQRVTASWPPAIDTLSVTAIGEYLLRGTYYDDRCLFKGIRKLPQASMLRITSTGIVQETWWRHRIQPADDETRSTDELIIEGGELIEHAVARSLQILKKPLLFLSGGVDSRLLLGALLKHGCHDIDAVTWGDDAQAGDMTVAAQLAAQTGLRHHTWLIEIDDFPSSYRQAILAVDGRADVMDAPSLEKLWTQAGEDYDGFLNGDECFGWRDEVASTEEALKAIGWWRLEDSARINDWLVPSSAKKIRTGIEHDLVKIISAAGQPEASDLKDQLYYRERLGNLLNAQLAAKLAVMMPAQPLLDEDVVEFFCGLPRAMRADKYLAREILKQRYPDLVRTGLAEHSALPAGTIISPAAVFRHPGIVKFVREQLFDKLDARLASHLDIELVRACFDALTSGKPLPEVQKPWYAHLPGAWRLLPPTKNIVHPVTAILRLLGLNLYLT